MKLVSTAKTIQEFKRDLISFIRLRAELQRSLEKTVRTKSLQKMYLHCAFALDSLADDIQFMQFDPKGKVK